jgi:hypothetical protein
VREIITSEMATEDPAITAAEFPLPEVDEPDPIAPAMTDVATEDARTAAGDKETNNVDGTDLLIELFGI